MEAVYDLTFSRFGELQAEVAQLNKRAARLGVPELVLHVLETWETEKKHPATGRTTLVRWVKAKLVGVTPKLAGWTFVATVEGHDAGNVLRAVPGLEETIPESYRTSPSTGCDHCKTDRLRRETYLVHHEDGRWAQVGSTCVRDFLGGLDPHGLAQWLELLADGQRLLVSMGGDGGEGMHGRELRWTPREVLVAGALAIRKWGWCSRKRAEETPGAVATSSHVLNLLEPPATGRVLEEVREAWQELSREDEETADAALRWGRSLAGLEKRSDFEHNLLVVLSDQSISRREVGIAVAAIPCWARAEERELSNRRWVRIDQTSAHQGAVGERREWDLEVMSYRTLEGNYGMTHMYKFADAAGNLFVWFGSTPLHPKGERSYADDPRLGDAVRVRATVKKHDSYKGTQQTILSRVELKEVIVRTAEKA